MRVMKVQKLVRNWAFWGVCVLALTGCEQTRQSLGLDRVPPDEFAVVTRAPLSVPPGIDLQPPRPGAARPQEPQTRDTATGVLFGNSPAPAQQAGALPRPGSLGLSGLGFGSAGAPVGTSAAAPATTRPVAAPSGPSAGERALLSMVGADKVDSTIRAQVDAETSARISADTRFVDRLLSLDVPQGVIVDASAEADRIRRNQALGLPLTQGEVPHIERRGRALFEGIF